MFDVSDSSVVHVGDGIGEVKDAVVVRHHDDGAIGMHRGAGEQFHHGHPRRVVERGGGFVADHQARFVNQRAGKGDALLLSTRELARHGIEPVPQAESDQQGFRPVNGFGAFEAGGEQRDGGVLGGGERRQQVVLLKYETEVPPAEENLVLRRKPGGDLTKQFNLAPGGIQQAGDDRDEGGLAASARADQECEFSLTGFEVYAAQRLDPRVAFSEMFPDFAAADGVDGYGWVHGAGFQPRKTAAGSRTRTRRMLNKLVVIATSSIITPTPTTFCQSSTIPRVGILPTVISKNSAARPVPTA